LRQVPHATFRDLVAPPRDEAVDQDDGMGGARHGD
jgi:hypothetical protein